MPRPHDPEREAAAKEIEEDMGLTGAVCTSGAGLLVAGLGGDWLSVSLLIGAPMAGMWATLRVRRVLAESRGRH